MKSFLTLVCSVALVFVTVSRAGAQNFLGKTDAQLTREYMAGNYHDYARNAYPYITSSPHVVFRKRGELNVYYVYVFDLGIDQAITRYLIVAHIGMANDYARILSEDFPKEGERTWLDYKTGTRWTMRLVPDAKIVTLLGERF
jgi:hypothetical protein